MLKKIIFHYKPIISQLSATNKRILYAIILKLIPKKKLLFNFFLKLAGIEFRINFKDQYIFYNKNRIYFSYLKRNSFYTNGIKERLNQISSEYLIDGISFHTGDLIIDCGANIGEFTISLNKLNPELKFICLEPELKEFNVLNINTHDIDSKNLNIALSNQKGEADFYKKNLNGDSSLFYTEDSIKTKVKVSTLDSLFDFNNLNRCKLLKLEAEGAEPEILMGGKKALKKINYVSVDCGPERGIEQEKTITAVTNIMYENNFELLDIHQRRTVLLFKNKLNLFD